MKPSLLVFGEDWQGLPSSTQHLVKALAKDYQILWVNSIGLRQPKWQWRDLQRAGRKLWTGLTSRLRTEHGRAHQQQANPNFQTLNVITWPAPKQHWLRKVCGRLIAWQVNRISQGYFQATPTLWVSLPTAVDACQHIPHRSLIYYCCDDFSSLAGVDHNTVTAHETTLINNADHIFVSQPSLQQKWPQKSSIYLPHGVDYSLFSSPAPRADDLPAFGLIAGFYGSIADWLDQALIAEVANLLPHWQFVFVGKIQTDISALSTLANVHFLGPKAHHLLPRYSQHWDVSLLPFRRCEQIEHCNPLKLREYLAAGTPVVSTPFPAAEAYQPLVHIADSACAFASALNLQLHSHVNKTHRQQAVAHESWSARAASLQHVLRHG